MSKGKSQEKPAFEGDKGYEDELKKNAIAAFDEKMQRMRNDISSLSNGATAVCSSDFCLAGVSALVAEESGIDAADVEKVIKTLTYLPAIIAGAGAGK